MNRLHPLSAVSQALNRGMMGLFVPIFLLSFLGSVIDFVDPFWGFFAAPVGFLGGVAYGIAYYYRFEYELTDSTVDIASGVISRRSREIPFRRVQNVDIRQSVIFQLLGLAVVTIETAGGGGAEATLRFVSEEEANRLQREIRRLTAAANADRKKRAAEGASQPVAETEASPASDSEASRIETDEAESASADGAPSTGPSQGSATDAGDEWADHRPRTLFELSPRELLLYSFASFRPAAVAGVVFFGLFASEFVIEYLVSIAQPIGGPAEIGDATTGNVAILTLVSAVHAIVVTYLLSVIYTFFTYYGFRLGRAGDDLVYERGLLQRYSGSIPLEKVQSVTITDNPIQRLIEYAGLWVETAGYGPDSGGGSQSAVPLAHVPRIYEFTERLTGVEPPRFERPTTVARRRYLARFSIVVTLLVAIAYGISLLTQFESWYLTVVLYLFVPPAAHLRWIHLGYYVGEQNLVIRSGFWRRRTTVIPYYRIQTISTRRSVFQRRLGLASLVVDTASSRTFFWATPTIYDVDLEVAREIHDTSRKHLQSALRERARADEIGMEADFM